MAGKPDNLHVLCNLAQKVDHRYWERKSERSGDGTISAESSTPMRFSDSNNRSTLMTTLLLQVPSGEMLSVDFYPTPLDNSV